MKLSHSNVRRLHPALASVLKSVGVVLTVTLLAACERPPMESVQHGYRGTGMVQIYNPRTVELNADKNIVPVALPPADDGGPKASAVFQNVKVLGDLSVGQFTRVMTAMTTWVAPKEGCVHCHNPANFADESKYTKQVSRKMIEMTQHINKDWQQHVGSTGVTCYTCHRGQNVPSDIWTKLNPPPYGANFIGDKAGQNEPSKTVGLASLPVDPFTPFLLGNEPIRVNGTTALPSGNRQSIKQAEATYSLMTHISTSLGVNCTYCHTTQSFSSWKGNPPQRLTAWHGIRMARDLNVNYMETLVEAFPAHRKGAMGDVAKLNCATCHQGAYKPLNGAPMAQDFTELGGLAKVLASNVPKQQ
ncbi:photosynthetic reaction center cytochrome PufC [uncultured Ramlibacter sp.]|uniref:photosynthetic reaction center cytochrome PufC n=1 Tax=uncultured Ramlibacter sp. TaxID=260755 RepID=UPI00262FCF78|nr:photosynthetic reaction center cytochrome PufC [uncultured Ramlibacter sp.]